MPTISSVLGTRLRRYFGPVASVSQWNDETGNAHAVQATSARQPSVTSTPCGETAVSFTSNGSFSTNADVMVASAAGSSSTPDYTVLGCILKVETGFTNDGTGNGCGVVGIGGTRCNIYIYPAVDNKLRAAAFGASSLAEQTTGTINDGKWHRVILHCNQAGDTITLYIDGVAQTTTVAADDGNGINLGTTDIFIGAGDASAVAPLQGIVGHVFVAQDSASFSGDIASLDRALAEQIRRINYGASGSAATGTTSLSVPYPSGIAAGDVLVLSISNKYPTNGPSTPSGFTLPTNGQGSGGAGSSGSDSGSVYATPYFKIADGTESGNLSVTITSGNCAVGRMFRYTVADGYSVDVAAHNGSDNTAGTSFSATAGADPGLTAGDMLVVTAATNTDARTYSAEAVSATSVSAWGTVVELNDSATSGGGQCRLVVSEHPVDAGTSSAAPVFTMTASGTTANQNAGAASFLRMRPVLALADHAGTSGFFGT